MIKWSDSHFSCKNISLFLKYFYIVNSVIKGRHTLNSSQIFIAFLCLIGYNDRCFLRALRFPTHKASKIKPLGFLFVQLSNVTK
ncbi:hypothetical protein [Moraxella lacunata]|uniref:hypothetical protein n=1 Tax=Moraxella lacunata TaxID=477 RepID=UPI003EE04FD0